VLLLLAHAYEARDVDALAKQLEVLHQLLRLELGVQQAQLIFKMAMCARSRLCCVPGKGRMGTLVSF
jgi:hypothetical protein